MIRNYCRKYGFNRAQRQSFKEWLEALQANLPRVHFFFPSRGDNNDDVLDSLLQSVGPVNAHGLSTRQVSSLITEYNQKYINICVD